MCDGRNRNLRALRAIVAMICVFVIFSLEIDGGNYGLFSFVEDGLDSMDSSLQLFVNSIESSAKL